MIDDASCIMQFRNCITTTCPKKERGFEGPRRLAGSGAVSARHKMITSTISWMAVSFVLTAGLFGRLVISVPAKEGQEFKDRLAAFQANSPIGDMIDTVDMLCSTLSCLLYIGSTYFVDASEEFVINTLCIELAFSVFFAGNYVRAREGTRCPCLASSSLSGVLVHV